jgi:hypothetical protein
VYLDTKSEIPRLSTLGTPTLYVKHRFGCDVHDRLSNRRACSRTNVAEWMETMHGKFSEGIISNKALIDDDLMCR